MLVFKKRKWILWLSALVLIVAVPITIFLHIIIHSHLPELAEGNQLALHSTNASTPVMMGVAKGAAHTAIEGNGGNHRGDLTAWMRYRLLDDQEAIKAFHGDSSEMMHNTNWLDVIQANMDDTTFVHP
ncbi:hypothetical protein AB4124_17475 [Paenibacillus sp. 2KB_20]|uniref:hypothetical protein n=1 Tax=Paenibacillus sp. 2KB_20 TaxID=3232977 RepID=UPI003F947C0C